MNVYMTGLIYLTGCGKDVRAYATKAPGHHASLWIEASALNEAATQWWPDLRREPRVVDKEDVIEFVIPGPAMVRFPGEGKADCFNLDDGLPKLQTKKKKKKAGEEDAGFEVNPATAVTNAEVEILGGSIRPRSAGSATLVEWITEPGLSIVIESKTAGSGTITLMTGDADVVFGNMHELPEAHGEKDHNRGNHVPYFGYLNPDPTVTVYSVSAKSPGNADPLHGSTSKALKFFSTGGCWCGNGTPCCCG